MFKHRPPLSHGPKGPRGGAFGCIHPSYVFSSSSSCGGDASLNGVGNIYKHGNNSIQYRVASLEGLAVIIAHLDKYPLITQKKPDYLLFKEAFNFISSKKHLSIEGIQSLLAAPSWTPPSFILSFDPILFSLSLDPVLAPSLLLYLSSKEKEGGVHVKRERKKWKKDKEGGGGVQEGGADITAASQLRRIKASINKGLSDILKADFPNTIPVPRPLIVDEEIKDPNWLAGFVSGEGCFMVVIAKSKSTRCGFHPRLSLTVRKHERDAQLMKNIAPTPRGGWGCSAGGYLNCGRYIEPTGYKHGVLCITKFSDISDKIIPLFNKYPIQGVKALDFSDFCKVAIIKKNQGHLKQVGLEEIRKIKAGMNRGRSNSRPSLQTSSLKIIQVVPGVSRKP
nr:hypothetical protein [Morchella crassipes]